MLLLSTSTCTCVYVNKYLRTMNKKQVRQDMDDDVARTRENIRTTVQTESYQMSS